MGAGEESFYISLLDCQKSPMLRTNRVKTENKPLRIHDAEVNIIKNNTINIKILLLH